MLGLRLEKTVAWRYFEIHTFFIWASSLKMAGKNAFLETDTVPALAFRSYKCCLQGRIACLPMEMDFYGLVRGPRYRFKKQNKKQCSTCCSSLATTWWSGTSIGALGHFLELVRSILDAADGKRSGLGQIRVRWSVWTLKTETRT